MKPLAQIIDEKKEEIISELQGMFIGMTKEMAIQAYNTGINRMLAQNYQVESNNIVEDIVDELSRIEAWKRHIFMTVALEKLNSAYLSDASENAEALSGTMEEMLPDFIAWLQDKEKDFQ